MKLEARNSKLEARSTKHETRNSKPDVFFPETFHNPARYRGSCFQEKGHACCVQNYVTV